MPSQPFDFQSPKGYNLSGVVEHPETAPIGWAVLAHCFTCGKDSLAAVRLARGLAYAGIGVLRFDFAGLGKSGGDFANTTFSADVDDLLAAVEAMAAAGMPPLLLVGHSLGGAAVLAAAGRVPTLRAVATIAAPARVSEVLRQFDAAALERIRSDGKAEVSLAGRPFVVRRPFVDDVQHYDLEQHIEGLHLPLLILHAPNDDIVELSNASRIFASAKHPKSFISLDDADHLLTRPADAQFAAKLIAAWAEHYLTGFAPSLFHVGLPDGVVAEETGRGLYQLAVRSGEHRFIADEPVCVGGLGSGLSPYEFVSAGLAACTTMTIRMYAQRKGIPLARARTAVVHSKPASGAPTDLFTRIITLEGPLDDEQRQKLLAVADRCPVDLTLLRGSDVKTSLTHL